MRIFLSYASEQHDLARRLALALRSLRNRVFFDRDALPPGGAFDVRIRASILRCHAFIFLASRHSLRVARLKKQRLRILALQCAAASIAIALGFGALFWILPTEKSPRNEDPFGFDGSMNAHVYTLKNKNQVRMVGGIVKNGSNVHDAIVRDGVEHNAWRYNSCYDRSFGHLSVGMPQGTVISIFELSDQLPRQERVDRSDFSDDGFNKCLLGILRGQTFNEAGSKGTGQVSYAFKFLTK